MIVAYGDLFSKKNEGCRLRGIWATRAPFQTRARKMRFPVYLDSCLGQPPLPPPLPRVLGLEPSAGLLEPQQSFWSPIWCLWQAPSQFFWNHCRFLEPSGTTFRLLKQFCWNQIFGLWISCWNLQILEPILCLLSQFRGSGASAGFWRFLESVVGFCNVLLEPVSGLLS